MPRPVPTTPWRPIVALLLGLGLLLGACSSPPSAPPEAVLKEDGVACGPEGSVSCRSGHCEQGLCCREGSCCLVPADCPAGFSAPASCATVGPATDCQGERRDATCQDFTCGTVTVADDSACTGLARDCGTFDPVTCSAAVDQPAAVCPGTCTDSAQCRGGHACVGGACVAITGLGSACTGTGQGSCANGLKCENAVCCDAAGATCCAEAAQCAGGLACDGTTSSCFTSCNDYDGSRCASAEAFCLGNACRPKLGLGEACGRPEQCGSGACECFDAACTVRRCRSAWCGSCEVAASDASCIAGLGTPNPVADPKPGECEGAVACYAGACKKNDGVTCSANAECGHVCINGACAPPSASGGPCDEKADCSSALLACCGTGGAPPLSCQTVARCAGF